MEILSLIEKIVKVVVYIIERYRQTPSSKRRQSLQKLDEALKLAKTKRDTRDLEAWIGKKL